MRPVNKGIPPKNKEGELQKYKVYKHYRRTLIHRIGEYCSYCERKIPVSLAVEHEIPKVQAPFLKLVWKNFLLGCSNCNSTKGSETIRLDQYFWPDRENTFLPFIYKKEGLIEIPSYPNNSKK